MDYIRLKDKRNCGKGRGWNNQNEQPFIEKGYLFTYVLPLVLARGERECMSLSSNENVKS